MHVLTDICRLCRAAVGTGGKDGAKPWQCSERRELGGHGEGGAGLRCMNDCMLTGIVSL